MCFLNYMRIFFRSISHLLWWDTAARPASIAGIFLSHNSIHDINNLLHYFIFTTMLSSSPRARQKHAVFKTTTQSVLDIVMRRNVAFSERLLKALKYSSFFFPPSDGLIAAHFVGCWETNGFCMIDMSEMSSLLIFWPQQAFVMGLEGSIENVSKDLLLTKMILFISRLI